MVAGPLAPWRVLDLTDGPGALCGKLLADLGADVVRVEPPPGALLRHGGPHAGDVADPARALDWWAFAANSRSVVADLAAPGGRGELLDLARRADVMVESFPPGHLDRLDLGWPRLRSENPRLVLTSITPFGADGPCRDWRGPDIVLQAMGGLMHQLGDRDRPPVMVGRAQAWLQAAGHAVVGTLVAHRQRERTGHGQHVEVSAQAAVVWTLMSESGMPPLHGYDPFRDGNYTRFAGFRRRMIFPCRDGHVIVILGGGAVGAPMLSALTAWMAEDGMAPPFMLGRDWRTWDTAHLLADLARGQAEIDIVTDAVGKFVAGKTKAELYEAALARGLLLAPVADISDLFRDPQLAARAFFVAAAEPRLGRPVLRPGPFARLSATPITRHDPAPAVGEHTAVVRQEWLAPPAIPEPPATAEPILPFAGLRVIDFAWVATGPITGRLLAEFGADVIRLESAQRIDPARTIPPWPEGRPGPNRSQLFANYNAGKRSVALDLARPRGQEIARALIARADVAIESFTPGTMARWGLDYASVRPLRPDLVYLSTCQQGQTGPYARYRGYGSLAAALAGFYSITGWPDREPTLIYGAYTDFVAHHFASAALLAALDHRRRTGEGQHIDVSQLEASLHFLAPEILDYAINGRVAGRQGNAHERWAPHNAYPCAGGDRWCVIACRDEAEWKALGRALGEPAWWGRPELASAEGRKAHEAELDRRLAEWTRTREPWALARELQAAGVPAGVVQSCADLHRDPQLAARRAFVWLDHPEMGRTPYEAWAFRCTERPARLRRAPCLGEHTDEVLGEVLGMAPAEIDHLREEGVLR